MSWKFSDFCVSCGSQHQFVYHCDEPLHPLNRYEYTRPETGRSLPIDFQGRATAVHNRPIGSVEVHEFGTPQRSRSRTGRNSLSSTR
jgi:hypothetical protein